MQPEMIFEAAYFGEELAAGGVVAFPNFIHSFCLGVPHVGDRVVLSFD